MTNLLLIFISTANNDIACNVICGCREGSLKCLFSMHCFVSLWEFLLTFSVIDVLTTKIS